MFRKKPSAPAVSTPTSPGSTSAAEKTPSTQTWLPIRDIQNGLIYRKDQTVLAAIHVQPVNLNLLSVNERKRRVKRLEEVLNGIDYKFQIFSIGKPVDLDNYIMELDEKRVNTDNPVKKKLLMTYKKQAAAKATSGEALERHFYFILDMGLGKKGVMIEQVLLERAKQLAANLTGADLQSNVCTDSELRTMNFIFTNPAHASFERAPEDFEVIPPVAFIEEVLA